MVDDDFTQPENDGLNVNRLVRRDVQVGVDPASLIPAVINDFKLENGLGDDDVISAAVVKKFRKEGNASGEWVVYYRLTGTLAVSGGLLEVSFFDENAVDQGPQLNGGSYSYSDPLGGPFSTTMLRLSNVAVVGDVSITGITFAGDAQDSGPPAQAFYVSLPAPVVLSPAQFVDVIIEFRAGGNPSPVPAGIYNVAISINHDAGNESTPFVFTVTGDSNFPSN